MAKQLALYESLPVASSRKIESCAVRIDKAKARGVALIFEIGEQLQIAHDELANHGDGKFGKWCQERCGISKSAAYRYLSVVEVFSRQKQLDGPTVGQSFDAKALYYLSRDTTPEAAIKDALYKAKRGERVTLADAKEIVEGYTIDAEPVNGSPDLLMLMSEAEDRIRKSFSSWPQALAKHIPSVLSALSQEDHTEWTKP
jgi:hypothetical protein